MKFGEFANLLAIITILSKLIDFGMGPILFRELSRDTNGKDLFNATITVKLILAGIIYLGMNVTFFFLSFTKIEIYLSNILFFSIFISSRMANFRDILSTPYKAKMDMQFPMFLNVLDSSLLLIGVLLIPYLKFGIVYFTLIYLLSNLPGFIFLIISLYNNFTIKIKLRLTKVGWLLKESIPLAGFVILAVIFQQIDIIIIKYSKTSYDAGIFSAAARLTIPLNIIPSTFITVIFPFIVKESNPESRKGAIIKLLYKLLFLISFIIAIVFSFKIEDFTILIFGRDYLEASLPASLLFWSQLFLFFNFFSLDLLTAKNLQSWNFFYALIIVIINISLDIILIPFYSYTGASIAKLVSSILGTAFLLYVLRKAEIDYNFFKLPILGFICLLIIIFYLMAALPFYLYLIIGIPLIVFLMYISGQFTIEEIKLILAFLNKEEWIKIFQKK